MDPTIQSTISDYETFKARLLRALAATPDDRLKWSPSETSRTPLQLVAHCANSTKWLRSSFAGEAMPQLSTAEFDKIHRENDEPFTSREAVLEYLEEQSELFLEWLGNLSADQLAMNWQSPFGEVPLVVAITFPGRHMDGHLSQLEYLQTIYGDRVWH